MPPISHQTLNWITIIAGLAGQFMLDSSPQVAILLCGLSLAANLVDGWWYVIPLGSRWWYPALIGVIGLTMWNHPRGWFFMAWAAVEIGTGLRAQSIWRAYDRARAEEKARAERLAAMGYGPAAEAEPEDEAEPAEPPAPPAPLPPIPLWRYPVALAMGLLAAWVGAWTARVVYTFLHVDTNVLAFFTGFMVGKAVTAGAGDRSNRFLQVLAAVLAGFGVVYGRFLVAQVILPGKSSAVVLFAILWPPGVLWLLAFVGVGAWCAWRWSRVERRV